METDIEKVYLNLNELLEDICKFLSGDKLGRLSPKDKKLAESLINRSKVQLQEIAKIQESSPNSEYVDMDSKKVIEEEEDKNNIYSSVDDINANVEMTIVEEGTVYPYKDLSAKEASQEVKYGFMSMRRKFLLGFEKMKRVYAAIHNQWLMIYWNDKDLKPVHMFDLKKHEARETDSDKGTNFELMGTSSDKKVYYFMALTRKDMLQWVVHINRCHDSAVIRSKGLDLKENRESINENDDIEEHYDSVGPQNNYKQNEEEEGEDIYLELDMVKPNLQNNNAIPPKKNPEEKDDHRPPLPGRRPLRETISIPVTVPIIKPSTPPHNDSDQSLVSYDDVGMEAESNESRNILAGSFDDSFSEDEEDCTYEAFVDVKNVVDRLKNQNLQQVASKNFNVRNENSSLKVVPKPPILPIKPKVKDKPTVAKKPLVLLRSNS